MKASLLPLALLLALSASSFALSTQQFQTIHAAVIATGDQEALDAFRLLEAEEVLETATGEAEDVLKVLSFRVLEKNREDITAAFMLLRRKGVFDQAAPPPPPTLSPDQRAAIDSAARSLEDMRRAVNFMDSLLGEFERAWTGFGQIKVLRKMDSNLSAARRHLDRAQRSLRSLQGVSHPDVDRVRAHEGEQIDRFNAWIRWVNRTWRHFQ